MLHGNRRTRRRGAGATTGAGTPTCDPPSAIHCSSRRRSRAVCQRSSGSFARHGLTTRSSAGGRRAAGARDRRRIVVHDRADQARLALPLERLRPVSISYSTAPNAKMSVRASASRPSSCSGAMYWKVPRIVPCAVSPAASSAGSSRRRRHDGVRRFREAEVEQLRAGLRQHDVAGLQIAMDDARAMRLVERPAISIANFSAWSSGSAPLSRRSASVSPSRYSMTRKRSPSCSPTS